MTIRGEAGFPHLPSAAASLARAFARPVPIAILALTALTLAGWAYLALMVLDMAAMGEAGKLGPGMGLLDRLLPEDPVWRAAIAALCRPTFGAGHFGMPGAGAWSIADFLLVVLMWQAMALAMMLPTAAPMIVTYAEIADTAAAKGEPAISPFVLIAGYLGVWFLFAFVAALAQGALTALALLDPTMAGVSGLFSGAVFIGAGLYQFSALKHACVTQCQRPFPFFFANWSDTAKGVFKLGIRQGVICLGCCWAMMLVAFAMGVMNVVWMVLAGLVMALEKVTATTRFSKAVGVALIAVGLVFVASALAAHWPVR